MLKKYNGLQIPGSGVQFAELQIMMTKSTIDDMIVYCCNAAFGNVKKDCRTTACIDCLFNPDISHNKEVFGSWLNEIDKAAKAAVVKAPEKKLDPLSSVDFLDKMSKLTKERR